MARTVRKTPPNQVRTFHREISWREWPRVCGLAEGGDFEAKAVIDLIILNVAPPPPPTGYCPNWPTGRCSHPTELSGESLEYFCEYSLVDLSEETCLGRVYRIRPNILVKF